MMWACRLCLIFVALSRATHFVKATACEDGEPAIPHPRSYTVHKLGQSAALVVDGRIDDPTWSLVPWTEEFDDIENLQSPKVMPKPRFKTRAKMLWDEKYLYIAAELEEPHIWANVSQHNQVIFNDNDFEVFIDPSGSTHAYKEFEINARNKFWDLMLPKPYLNGGKPVCDNPALCSCCWDIVNDTMTGVEIYPKGASINDGSQQFTKWTVEIALPISRYLEHIPEALREYSIPKHGVRWRLNFSRVEYRVKVLKDGKTIVKLPGAPDNWVWQPTGVVDIHLPERWGVILFSEAPANQATLESDVPQYDPTWKLRAVLSQVYEAQLSYKAQYQDGYAYTIERLVQDGHLNPRVGHGTCGTGIPEMYVDSKRSKYKVIVQSIDPERNTCYVGTVRQDRLTLVHGCKDQQKTVQ